MTIAVDQALRAAARLAQAKQNPDTWRQMIAFYEALVSGPSGTCLSPLLRLVRQIAASDRARSFRAGQSLWRLIISTAAHHGLSPDDPYVLVTLKPEVQFGGPSADRERRLRAVYHDPAHGVHEEHVCREEKILATLDLLLERLWNDSRSRLEGEPHGIHTADR